MVLPQRSHPHRPSPLERQSGNRPRSTRRLFPGENPRRLANRVALITGAGRGIGRATAERFAREGARLVICSRTRRELSGTMAAIRAFGGDVTGRIVNIGCARQAQGVVDLAIRRYGRLDILINNASILGPRVPIIMYPLSDWTDVLRINLSGTFYVSQHAAGKMVEQRHGCIITLSSSVGRVGRRDWGAYAVSKFGVEGLSQVMADELRSHGLCILTFNPGGTRTRMRAEAYPSEDRSKLRDPARIAEALVELTLAASPAISGQAFDLDHLP